MVIGSSGGIGQAFLSQLRGDPRCAVALGLHRASDIALDLHNEASVQAAARAIAAQGPFHLIVHAAGVLHAPGVAPEKRLAQLRMPVMEQVFRVNALGPALVLAHFAPLLDRQRGLLAVLSAKVGSIGDNRLGGWYSYRASKAALNMFIKTAAIEVARTQPQAVLVALHPGTVRSGLSAPFRGEEIGRPAPEAVGDMLRVLDGLTPEDSGGFFSYTGERLPW